MISLIRSRLIRAVSPEAEIAARLEAERRADEAALANIRRFLVERHRVLGMEGREISRMYDQNGEPIILLESDLFRVIGAVLRAKFTSDVG